MISENLYCKVIISDKLECLDILDNEIKKLNDRIISGEEIMQDCKDQMKNLLAKKKWLKEYREAINQENLQKIERMKIMLDDCKDEQDETIRIQKQGYRTPGM